MPESMIGRLAYKLKSTFSHGLRVAWYRDVVRKRILSTAPIVADDTSVAEIHVLTSESDYINLIWALKSFYSVVQRKYGLCIHDDGSLLPSSKDQLTRHFPHSRIVDRKKADAKLDDCLSPYPRCQSFRRENHLAPKIFDFKAHLSSNKMILLDSDVLFFNNPDALVQRIESTQYCVNSVNRDVASAYTVREQDALTQCGVKLIDRFNSGLGVIQKDSIRWDWIEEFLSLPNIRSHFWRIEQTLFALSSSRFGVELLPPEYDVFLSRNLSDQPSRHYVGAIRHHMYGEGMRRLANRPWMMPDA